MTTYCISQKKSYPSSTICKKPLVDITNITPAGSFQKRSIKNHPVEQHIKNGLSITIE